MSILKNGVLIAFLAALGFGLAACESTMGGGASQDSGGGEAVQDEPQPQ